MSHAPDIFVEKDKKAMKEAAYVHEYAEFLEKFDSTQTSAAEIGELIARMSQYYSQFNLTMGRALKLYNKVAKDCHAQIDNNGKQISAAKADVETNATPEAAAYQEARIHVQNIEQNINALKALQRGIQNEYIHQ